MANFHRHLPLLTSCIEFSDKPLTPLPVLTADVDFGAEDPLTLEVTYSNSERESERERSPTLSSISDIDDLVLTSNKKIPRPAGQPGRPQSGGYSLDEELKGWGSLLSEVKGFVHAKCEASLDTTKSYSKQDAVALSTALLDTKNAHPIVDGYENLWPVHDIIKLYLKKTSEAHRKQHKR